jgi:hypothetical protein
MPASTVTKIRTRRHLEILADTTRQAEATVAALRYAAIINDACQVVIKRDKAQGLTIATITLNYALADAAIQQLRSF